MMNLSLTKLLVLTIGELLYATRSLAAVEGANQLNFLRHGRSLEDVSECDSGTTTNELSYTCTALGIDVPDSYTITDNVVSENYSCGQADGSGVSATVDCTGIGTGTVVCLQYASSGHTSGSCGSCETSMGDGDLVDFVTEADGTACIGQATCSLSVTTDILDPKLKILAYCGEDTSEPTVSPTSSPTQEPTLSPTSSPTICSECSANGSSTSSDRYQVDDCTWNGNGQTCGLLRKPDADTDACEMTIGEWHCKGCTVNTDGCCNSCEYSPEACATATGVCGSPQRSLLYGCEYSSASGIHTCTQKYKGDIDGVCAFEEGVYECEECNNSKPDGQSCCKGCTD